MQVLSHKRDSQDESIYYKFYVCRQCIQGRDRDNATYHLIKYSDFLGADKTNITQPPQDYTATVGTSAVFQCTAQVPNQRTIQFEMFGENITTDDSNCITTGFSIIPMRTCNRVIESHVVSLTCDYSIEYQINCTLSVNNVSRSSDVFCRVINQSTVEATERAELMVVSEIESSQGRYLFFILGKHVVMS